MKQEESKSQASAEATESSLLGESDLMVYKIKPSMSAKSLTIRGEQALACSCQELALAGWCL